MKTTPDINEIRARLLKHFSPENCFVFIFGSRADNTAGPVSDWDIGVISNINLSGSLIEKARSELENIRTLHSFDLVDFKNTNDNFRKTAIKNVKPLIGSLEAVNKTDAKGLSS